MKKIRLTELLIFVVFTELTGLLSAILSGGFAQMYSSFEKPPFSPPGWLFPVAWTILYALMGISAYIIWNSDKNLTSRKKGLTVYGLQLLLNFLWSIIFFRFKLPLAALIDLILLIVSVTAMILIFRKNSKLASLINIPYIIWLLYAAYLNTGIVILNGR